jgi:hypothetical protein
MMGLLTSADAAALGALLASITAVMVAWTQGHKATVAATAAADLISTNTSTSPGEYLEMIGDIRATLTIIEAKVDTALWRHGEHEAKHHSRWVERPR